MAHKTNNPIHDFGDQPFDQPFEKMLRRHLQRGGAVVAPCAGFDAEAANAYLEHALLPSSTQSFETHLAGCIGCRRHITALTRLNAELAPPPVIAVTPQVSSPNVEPLWQRWAAQAGAWWNDLSWNWGLAGAGAMASVLLATMALYGWQQRTMNQPAAMPAMAALNSNAAQPPAQASVGDSTVESIALREEAAAMASPASSVMSPSASANVQGSLVKNEAAAPITTASLPNLGEAKPHLSSESLALTAAPVAPARVIDASEEVIALRGDKVSAPVVLLPNGSDFFGNRQNGMQGTPVGFNQLGGVTPKQLYSFEPPAPLNSLNLVRDQLERQSNLAEIVTPESRRQLARADAEKDKGAKAAKSEPGRARAVLNTLLAQRNALSFAAKQPGADAPTKEAEKTTDVPLVKPLTKRVNGHTFYFERGYWIDENYKSDTTLPLVKLTRGTQRYQQVLIENPTLEEFFQLGQIIVLWKGKVYEVRK